MVAYVVYWSMVAGDGTLHPRSHEFLEGCSLTEVLKFTEDLRMAQRDTGHIRFITMVAENKNSVGQAGAADVEVGYNWKKRRS